MNARQTNQPQDIPAPTERKVQPYLRLIKPCGFDTDGLTPRQRGILLFKYLEIDMEIMRAVARGGQRR